MSQLKTVVALCLSAAAFATMAIAAPSTPVVSAAENSAQPLTLTGAKHIVADQLAEMGQAGLRPGHAEFDKDGNVSVDIVDISGLTVRHVLVDAKSGQVTDARTRAPLSAHG
ncbi:MAG TPA: hypothetical protein VKZ79_08660 [Alphaproteobacteria bacterium]|nr:hypothetical protein [Alphaproteobacteria bacterium]